MKLFILLVFLAILFFTISKFSEKFDSDSEILEKDFKSLIKDDSETYFSSLKCLDYEDIRI